MPDTLRPNELRENLPEVLRTDIVQMQRRN